VNEPSESTTINKLKAHAMNSPTFNIGSSIASSKIEIRVSIERELNELITTDIPMIRPDVANSDGESHRALKAVAQSRSACE
jgi:hypothetical protein